MDLKRHQKINGLEAIKIWTKGGVVYDAHGAKYAIDKEDGFLWYASPFHRCGYDRSFNEIVKNDWYVPKPFDVRKAMINRPNEWVGAWKSPTGEWRKLGLNYQFLEVVETKLSLDLPVDMAYCGTGHPTAEQLENCIPIEDVPEDEK